MPMVQRCSGVGFAAAVLMASCPVRSAVGDDRFTYTTGMGGQVTTAAAGIDGTVNSDISSDPADAILIVDSLAAAGTTRGQARQSRVQALLTLHASPSFFAFSAATAYVTVNFPTPVDLSWAWEDGDAGTFTVAISEFTPPNTKTVVAGQRVFDPDAPGSVAFTLQPGTVYFLEVYADASGAVTASATIAINDTAPACPCDFDSSGALNTDDVQAFVEAFLASTAKGDCDGSGAINVDDVQCFADCFLGGCP